MLVFLAGQGSASQTDGLQTGRLQTRQTIQDKTGRQVDRQRTVPTSSLSPSCSRRIKYVALCDKYVLVLLGSKRESPVARPNLVITSHPCLGHALF